MDPTSPTAKRLNLSAGIASVTVAIALVAIKLWALWTTGALTVAASLADNALDLMVSLLALAAIAYAARPADDDHSFGHSSAEDLAGLMQAAVILVSAGVIGVAAVARLTADAPPQVSAEGAGIAAMALSIVLTGGLVLWQRHVARLTGSRVVAADQMHYLADLVPTLGVLVALAASALWEITRLDAAIALAAALWLGHGGIRVGRGAWNALMDHAASADTVERIHAIARDWPGIVGFHDLKTRTAGSRTFVSLHVELDGQKSLNAAHAIADGLEHALEQAIPGAEVIIHLDPVGPGSGRQPRG